MPVLGFEKAMQDQARAARNRRDRREETVDRLRERRGPADGTAPAAEAGRCLRCGVAGTGLLLVEGGHLCPDCEVEEHARVRARPEALTVLTRNVFAGGLALLLGVLTLVLVQAQSGPLVLVSKNGFGVASILVLTLGVGVAAALQGLVVLLRPVPHLPMRTARRATAALALLCGGLTALGAGFLAIVG